MTLFRLCSESVLQKKHQGLIRGVLGSQVLGKLGKLDLNLSAPSRLLRSAPVSVNASFFICKHP